MPGLSTSLSVKVIIHNQQGDVLLLQRSPTSRNNAGKWEFPGGKIDPGESFEHALVREVREETGLTIDLKGSFGLCQSKRARPPVVYLVMEAEASKTAIRLSGEHLASEWVSPARFDEIQFCPQFRSIARRYAQEVEIEPRGKQPEHKEDGGKDDLFKDSAVCPRSLARDLAAFNAVRKRYEHLAAWLEKFLRAGVRAMFPLAEVGARAKDPVSFATKLIKKNKYKDPLHDVTDLAGARIVLHLPSEVEAVCRWIESQFEIDRANSGDKLKDLGAEKFGYRSVHYVVEMRPNKPAGLPPQLRKLKAEIQVRTIAQHAWSDIGHDRVYKAECDIPDYWKREANRIAALLEAADDAFARLVQGISAFQDHMRQSPDEKSARRQIALWDKVSEALPAEPRPALRAARLSLEIEDWPGAIAIAKAYTGKPTAGLLCAKGYALCKKARHRYAHEWRAGIAALKRAAAMSEGNIEPELRLAELLAPVERGEALEHYARAFAIDSSNPAALVGYIRCKVLEEKTTAFIPLLRPEIEQVIGRSHELAAAGADLPQALYRIAGLHLLLGRTHCHESMDLFAKAVHQTTVAPDPLAQTLRDVSQLARYMPERADIECARRFLAAALMAKFPMVPWPEGVARPDAHAWKPCGSVVIVAGGCDAYHEPAMLAYGDLLKQAFADYRGTIISGGTRQGISGLVGKLAAASGGRIRAVGYLPPHLPADNTATRDERYVQSGGELRLTDGGADEGFSARQPIQNWLDLLAAGIHPNQVRVLGINGGNIAGLEYRLAVALGATVGVIEGSGREAETVLNDWPARPVTASADGHAAESVVGSQSAQPAGKLLPLPADPATLRAFLHLGIGKPEALSPQAVEQAARLVHQDFLDQQRYGHPDAAMQPWPRLRSDLQGSNRSQVEYLVSVLRANEFGVRPLQEGAAPNDPKFTNAEIKKMGAMEHGRWNVERLESGWRYARKKDMQKRLSPYIRPWRELEPGTKKWDFLNVRLWPEILAEVGYEIYRL